MILSPDCTREEVIKKMKAEGLYAKTLSSKRIKLEDLVMRVKLKMFGEENHGTRL